VETQNAPNNNVKRKEETGQSLQKNETLETRSAPEIEDLGEES